MGQPLTLPRLLKMRLDIAPLIAPQKIDSLPSDIDVARRVLASEAAGLAALADVLDHNFVKAVDIMAAAKGRVVVSGMGKSGNIAQKLLPRWHRPEPPPSLSTRRKRVTATLA